MSTFVSILLIKKHMGVSAARACGVSMVKILNKCILRQIEQYFIYMYPTIFPYIGILAIFMK